MRTPKPILMAYAKRVMNPVNDYVLDDVPERLRAEVEELVHELAD